MGLATENVEVKRVWNHVLGLGQHSLLDENWDKSGVSLRGPPAHTPPHHHYHHHHQVFGETMEIG